MSSELQPIKVYGRGGPNPPKVAFVLEELGLPHEIISIPISDVKNPDYVAINPNGRLPAIHDPNSDITLWESGAIMLYLVERYDKEYRISFPLDSPEAQHARQWLFFQTTGQGPYYGQAFWFKNYHPEPVPSAVERYVKEIHRVSAVLEGWLATQEKKFGGNTDGPWLVGNKLSYADLSFIPWQGGLSRWFKEEEYNRNDYPRVKEWIGKMVARQKIRAVLDASGFKIPEA